MIKYGKREYLSQRRALKEINDQMGWGMDEARGNWGGSDDGCKGMNELSN